jgi:hypothetical protein
MAEARAKLREEVIALAHEHAKLAHNGSDATVPAPHEWVIDALMEARSTPLHDSVQGLVLDFRDCFLTLVDAYNRVGAYGSAADAQAMALALHKFEGDHRLDDLAWPLELVKDEHGRKGLKSVSRHGGECGEGIFYGGEL